MNDVADKLEFKNLGKINKDDVILIRFSMNKKEEDYISPEKIGMFAQMLYKQGYNIIALPKETCVTVENAKYCLEMSKLSEGHCLDILK